MLRKLEKYSGILMKTTFALVEVSFYEEIRYNLLFMVKQGDNLAIEKSFQDLDYNAAIALLTKNIPILLHFSGKFTVNKKVSSESNYSREILFGASPSDFYMLEVKQGQSNFVSVARRELIDEVLQNFKKLELFIVDFTLGPFINVVLVDILSSKDVLHEKDFTLFVSKGTIIDFEESDKGNTEEYPFGNDTLKGVYLPLVSTLLNYLYPSEVVNYDTRHTLQNRNEFKLRKIFNTSLISILLFFLSSLIVSYIIFNYQTDKYLVYQKKLDYLNNTYKQVKVLEKEKIRKQAIIKETGMLSNRFVTEYLYDIGNSVPSKITLSNLAVNPVLKRVKAEEPLVINKGVIRISGKTKSSKELNTWILVLKQMDWVKDVEIIHFLRNRENYLQFDLEVIYKQNHV